MRLLAEQADVSRLLGLRDLALLHTFGNEPRICEICGITRNRLRPRGRGYVAEVRGKNKTEYRDVPLTRGPTPPSRPGSLPAPSSLPTSSPALTAAERTRTPGSRLSPSPARVPGRSSRDMQ